MNFSEQSYSDECFEGLRNDSLALTGKTFTRCVFRNARFDKLRLTDCRLEDCEFLDCALTLCVFAAVSLADVRFTRCKITGLEFGRDSVSGLLSRFSFLECRFVSCAFTGADLPEGTSFAGSSFSETSFQNCRMVKADLSATHFSDGWVTGCDLSGADLRDSIGLAIDPRETLVKQARFSLDGALSLLAVFDIKIE